MTFFAFLDAHFNIVLQLAITVVVAYGAYEARRGAREARKAKEVAEVVHVTTNSKMDKLLEKTEKLARLEGAATGRRETLAEQATKDRSVGTR